MARKKHPTIREQLLRGLERLGYVRKPIGLRRYDRLALPGALDYVYVGRNGALRGGGTASKSTSLLGLKAKALAAGCSENAAC